MARRPVDVLGGLTGITGSDAVRTGIGAGVKDMDPSLLMDKGRMPAPFDNTTRKWEANMAPSIFSSAPPSCPGPFKSSLLCDSLFFCVDRLEFFSAFNCPAADSFFHCTSTDHPFITSEMHRRSIGTRILRSFQAATACGWYPFTLFCP